MLLLTGTGEEWWWDGVMGVFTLPLVESFAVVATFLVNEVFSFPAEICIVIIIPEQDVVDLQSLVTCCNPHFYPLPSYVAVLEYAV